MATTNPKEVTLRNAFYRDGERKLIIALCGALAVIIILCTILGYIVANPPQPKYFATSISGRITPLTALDMPNQSDSAVLQWAVQAAIASFTYNFVNYHEELKVASAYYTTDGWREFMGGLKKSSNLDIVKTKKLIVSAVATKAPVILQKGLLNGRFSWRVQMPVLITYQSASEFTQQDTIVTMLITRISTIESPRGIGIAQFFSGPADEGLVS